MNCALRSCVYAFVTGLLLFPLGYAAFAKDGKDSKLNVDNASSAAPDEFHWNDHYKLSWDDFRGPVRAMSEESAAATNCAIGFKTSAPAQGGKPRIIVYNTFYANRSWVRSDARIQTILVHEQGHFDLCEIYTRKLRQRMDNFNFDVADVRAALMNIYTQLQNEYETRQQAYEAETTHGTNIPVQKQWQQAIQKELAGEVAIVNN